MSCARRSVGRIKQWLLPVQSTYLSFHSPPSTPSTLISIQIPKYYQWLCSLLSDPSSLQAALMPPIRSISSVGVLQSACCSWIGEMNSIHESVVDYVCPFSAKLVLTIDRVLRPLLGPGGKYDGKVKAIFRPQVQPWHGSSTFTHEAGLAVN